MNENWYVLYIAIELNVAVEQAFILFKEGKKRRWISKDDELDMIKMKEQGLTYPEIGEIYGITGSCVCHRVRKNEKLKFEEVKESRGWQYQQARIV